MVVSVVSCPFLCVVVVFTQEQQKFTSISLLHCSCFAEEAVPEVEGNSSLYIFFSSIVKKCFSSIVTIFMEKNYD